LLRSCPNFEYMKNYRNGYGSDTDSKKLYPRTSVIHHSDSLLLLVTTHGHFPPAFRSQNSRHAARYRDKISNERTNDMSDNRSIGDVGGVVGQTSVIRVILPVLCRNSAERTIAPFSPPMGCRITAMGLLLDYKAYGSITVIRHLTGKCAAASV